MGNTHYPPGVDGNAIMERTADALQRFLRRLGCGDEIAIALDDDMIEVKISGMGARALMRHYQNLDEAAQ